MASQPLNSTISIYRTLRSQRSALRVESIKALTARLRPKILQIPGLETPYVSALKTVSGSAGLTTYDEGGRPLVIGVRALTSFDKYVTLTGFGPTGNPPSIDFPFNIGEDSFIQNTPLGLATSATVSDGVVTPPASDLFASARAIAGAQTTNFDDAF